VCVHGQSAEEGAAKVSSWGCFTTGQYPVTAIHAPGGRRGGCRGAAAAQLIACGAHNIPAAVAGGSIVRVAFKLMPALAGDRDGRAEAPDALVGPG
jgi:hypothetical protein